MASATQVPSIKLNMKNPYSAETHRKCVPIWKKVYPSFKDLDHRPPFELAYACYLNLINFIKKSYPCSNCNKPLEGAGLYFPIEDHHIMPLPCCEKCCTFEVTKNDNYYSMDSKSPNRVEVTKNGVKSREVRTFIYVNKYHRAIKFYSWKMMVCANLVVPLYNKMIKEEEDAKKETNHQKEIIEKKEDNREKVQNTIIQEEVQNNTIQEEFQNNMIQYNNIDTNNYYFGHITETDNDFYKNLYLTTNEDKKENHNVLMIYLSCIATILFSSIYFIFANVNK